MAEIKKINGNALCDETAREKADAAQAVADEAKTVAEEAKGLAETAGEGVTEAKTAAETAQETADKANDRGKNLAYHLKGKAMAAQYDATVGKLKCAAYSPDSTGVGTTYVGYQEVKKIAVIWVGDRAYTVQSSKAYNSVVATCPDEDGLHILTGGFKNATGVDCEFTETVVPYVEQVQADWSESDPESPAYIQNRIGGYKRSEAERLVEYDETTAEYIDVDVTGSGTALRYRKASDTLVRKEDWVGGKTVIVIDEGSGEQETTMGIGTGESNAIDIVEEEFAAGKIWLTIMGEMCWGIIAPQETDLSASADGVSVVMSSAPSGVVPKGVWIMDMPYLMNLMYGGEITGYHKAVYYGAMAKIPEEYLDTTTAEEAKTTAEEAKTTAEEAKTTAEEAKTTAKEAKTTAEEAETTAEEAKTTAKEAKTTAGEAKTTAERYVAPVNLSDRRLINNNVTLNDASDIHSVIIAGGVKYIKISNLVYTSVNEGYTVSGTGKKKTDIKKGLGCICVGEAVCVYRTGDCSVDTTFATGSFTAYSTGVYVKYVKDSSATVAQVYIAGCCVGGIHIINGVLTVDNGKLLLDGEPVSTTYTAGDGIAIEDGVITADVSGKLDKENPVATGSFSLGRKSGTTVGVGSFAVGGDTSATKAYSTAFGSGSLALGLAATAEGYQTIASGHSSHAEGYGTIANGIANHVQGMYNVDQDDVMESDYPEYLHIVGNGSSDSSRSNAHTLDRSGNAWFSGDVYVGSTSGTNKDDGSVKLAKVTETVSTADTATEATEFYLKSSTADSEKRFKITVDDTGALTATEVV